MMAVMPRQFSKTKSKRSTSSSVIARTKKFELEAPEAIEMELIDKRLTANLV